MKLTKPNSLTTDTHYSHSHILNNKTVSNKKQPYHHKSNNRSPNEKPKKNNYYSMHQVANMSEKKIPINNNFLSTANSKRKDPLNEQCQRAQSRELQFLTISNKNLREKIYKMAVHIKNLQENKIYLMGLNEKYIQVINQYYRDLHYQYEQNKKSKASLQKSTQKKQFKQSQKVVRQIKKEKNQKNRENCRSQNQNTHLLSINEQNVPQKVLSQLQKDHRNLVKHCLVMQGQIKNYAKQMQLFNEMKSDLLSVNHTSPKELIQQLKQTVQENRQLKKQNNYLSYQLEKSKNDCERLRKAQQNKTKQLEGSSEQVVKLRANVIKVQQENRDQTKFYEQRIYELELKVQKLEKQLRMGQEFVVKNEEKRKKLQIQRVQNIHQNSFLKANLSQMLDPKKHPLLSLERSFFHKGKKNKSIKNTNLNQTMLN